MAAAAPGNPASTEIPYEETRFIWVLVFAVFAVKLLFAVFLPLGIDENYAIAVAQEFSWSFFDHPPIGFWAPVIAAKLTGLDHNFIYRIPFLLFGIGTAYALFTIASEIKDKSAGLWTVFLYSVAPFFIFGGGVIAIPDGPVGFSSAMCAVHLLRIVRAEGKEKNGQWVAAGVWLGIALASKYQSGLIPISALVFVVLNPIGRNWFSRPGLYIGSAVGLIGLVPVLVWNIQHDWASFSFHSSRANGAFNLLNFGLLGFIQLAYLLPTVFFACLAGLWFAFHTPRRADVLLLALIALGPILMFNYIYLYSQGSYGHWSMPGWLFALPLAGIWLSGKNQRFRNWFKGTSVVLAGLMILILTILTLHMKFGVVAKYTNLLPARQDRTVDSFDWSDLEGALNDRGLLADTDILVVRSWYEGGEMSTALNGAYPVRVVGRGGHHFDYMSGADAKGNGLLLIPESLALYEERKAGALQTAQLLDQNAVLLEPIILDRGGVPYAAVMVVQLQIR